MKEPFLPPQYAVKYTGTDFDLPLALNAAYAHILRHFFFTAPPSVLQELDVLEAEFLKTGQTSKDENTRQTSIRYGQTVAETIWVYSKTDKIGHDAFLYNYDKTYIPPQYKGSWQPSTTHPMPALLPHWSAVRTFVTAKEEIAVKLPLPFAESPSSGFYKQAMEVYLNGQERTFEDIWVSEFWSDDLEGLTILIPT